jgi:hypothetical protein
MVSMFAAVHLCHCLMTRMKIFQALFCVVAKLSDILYNTNFAGQTSHVP